MLFKREISREFYDWDKKCGDDYFPKTNKKQNMDNSDRIIKVNKPTNRCGNLMGRITASFRDSFATCKPATSSQRMLGVSITITPEIWEAWKIAHYNLNHQII